MIYKFLNGDLAFTIDYFYNKRSDILWKRNASVPSTSGLVLPDENLGKVQNQGVDFNIDYRRNFKDFRLGINLNRGLCLKQNLFWDRGTWYSRMAEVHRQTYRFGTLLRSYRHI